MLVLLILTGSGLVWASYSVATIPTPLGTSTFFALAAFMAVCQAAMLAAVWHRPPHRRLLLLAFLVAVACRVPLAMGEVTYTSDMIRYIWDGRVQRLGYNPYELMPNDPALAHTHDETTARMPSANVRTPYPPAAQLFFRAVVTVTESARVMKFVLTACDLLTMLVLWRWLRVTGRNEWLTLAYAWNPLVILEVAHSGHIDALGALWIVLAAYWLTTRRTALATVAFTLSIATKLLPIVLVPLLFGRIRPRDIALGATLMGGLYLPFFFGATLPPVGAVPSVVEHIRFNSPIFRPLAWVITPQGAAAFAVLVGLGAALWARFQLRVDDPAAWAWPMALALVCAPVIYPWYLLYFTPFLFTRLTLPLLLWTYTVIPAYIVWERARHGARWIVPLEVMILQYGLLAVTAFLVVRAARRVPMPEGTPAES
jgi:alpha-1,6-mannosyltransferase